MSEYSIYRYLARKEKINNLNDKEIISAEDAYGDNLRNKTIIRDEFANAFYIFNSESDMWKQHETPGIKNWHEVILNNLPQRLKFDIDATANKIKDINLADLGLTEEPENKIITVLNLIINRIIETFKSLFPDTPLSRECIIVTNSSGQDEYYKFSFHIIIIPFGVLYAEEAQNFTMAVANTLSDSIKSIIDLSVNKSRQNFRLIDCAKVGSKRTKRIDLDLAKLLGTSLIEDKKMCLIRNDFITILPSLLTKSISKMVADISTSVINQVIEMLNDKCLLNGFIFHAQNNNILSFRRILPTICPIHKITHEHENMFVTIYNSDSGKKIYYNCYRKYSADERPLYVGAIKDTTGTIEKIETDTNIIRRIDDIMNKRINPHSALASNFEKLPSELCNIYNEPSLRPYELKNTLCVSAQMKMGKTKTLKAFIEQNFPSSTIDAPIIRFISARMTFSASLAKDFADFTVYKDIVEQTIYGMNYPRVIVQVESLHRLNVYDDVDLLILDEAESIFEQFNSPLHRNLQKTFAIFEKMMRDAKYVILMDANLSNRSYNILRELRPNYPIYFHQNTHSKAGADKYFFTGALSTWYNKLELVLRTPKRIIMPTNSLKEAENCKLLIEKYCHAKSLKKNIMIYTSKTSVSVKNSHFGDVNTFWKDYDIIIYTPTMSAGVSFEEAHFDVLFGYFNDNSCTVEICRQMLGRVRNLRDKEHYICLIASSRVFYPTDINVMKNLIYSNRGALSDTELKPPCFMQYASDGRQIYYEAPYSKMWFENVRMENISKNNFINRFIDQVADSGAAVNVLEASFIDGEKYGYLYTHRSEANEEILIENARKIAKAEDKTKEEIKDIDDRIRLQLDVTDEERASQEKYYFKDAFDWHNKPITEEFVKTYNKDVVKKIFRNLNDIKAQPTIEESLKVMKDAEAIYYKKSQTDMEYESVELQMSKLRYKYHKHNLAQCFLKMSNLSMVDRKQVHWKALYKNYLAYYSYFEDPQDKQLIINIIEKRYNLIDVYKAVKHADSEENIHAFIGYVLKYIINPFLKSMYGIYIKKELKDDFYVLENDVNGKLFILSDKCPIVISRLNEKYIDYRDFDRLYYSLIAHEEGFSPE